MRCDAANPINCPVVSFEATRFSRKSKRFNCKISVNNQLVPNTILDKKVGHKYNFTCRTIVLLVKQKILVFYKNISFAEVLLEMILQKNISILGIGVIPNKRQKEW